MNAKPILSALVVGLSTATAVAQGFPTTREATVVQSATIVLNEIMQVPAKRIPRSLLANAQALVIIPDVVKGGFVVGIRRGKGVVLVRDEQGNWQPPQFLTLTGGSVGFQAGVQATDVILVFKTRKSVQGLLSGKFTIGADAAAAAGPVGRQASAATDARFAAEIYSYSRSRGLFAGVSLDGSALEIDHASNASYYGAANTGGTATAPLPAEASQLMQLVATYTAGAGAEQPSVSAPLGTPAIVQGSTEQLRQQLASASTQLQALLDPSWKTFLALPAEVYSGTQQPSVELVAQALARFDKVAGDAQYQSLTRRFPFQTTHRLLRNYLSSLSAQASTQLPLPPPPSTPANSSGPQKRY